jgi:hypothetical protein
VSIPPPPSPQGSQGSQGSQGPQGPQGPQNPYAPTTTPGPHAQSPYGPPYAHPYPHHPSINGVAISALVLGILCFLPAIGLILGLIALAQIKKKGERGKGMAIAGSVLSSVGLTVWILSLSTGFAADAWNSFKDAATGEGTAYALTKGDCFNSSTGSLEGETYDVDEVPCTGKHDAEVFAVLTVPGTTFPGDDEVTRIADDQCYALQDDYAKDSWAVPDDIDVYYLLPTRQTWRLGDRAVTCMFGNTDSNGTLTGSLRRDYMTLDSYQMRFLSASNTIDDVLFEQPEDYPEEDLAANKAWAKDVHRVLGTQIEDLRTHPWPEVADRPVAAFLDDLEAARKEWARAAAADDADAFYLHYDKAYEDVDGPTTVAVRKALDLNTTVPDYSGDGGDSPEDGPGDSPADGGALDV